MTDAKAAETSLPADSMKPAVPIMAVVFLSFLVIGMVLPVLPLHVHDDLGFGPSVVGLVAGAQFVAALISRLWAGRLADSRGSKYAVTLGLAGGIAGGAFYVLSLMFLDRPLWSVSIILVGRFLLGGAESLIITGGLTWGLALVSARNAGKVISWVGMSMFAALAAGAPLGSLIFQQFAFTGIALATTFIPLMCLAFILPLRAIIPAHRKPARISTVLGAVFLPGIGFALSGITFGSVTAFLTLYFSVNDWRYGSIAFTIFALALIVTRVFFGHLPDRFGGAKIAAYCLLLQAAGLLMIGTAGSGGFAMIGSAISGIGFSLVFPALGLEAVSRAPAESRGLAMGTYNAFLDLTLGLGSPAIGLLGSLAGLGAVFVMSAIAALVAIPIALRLMRTPAVGATS